MIPFLLAVARAEEPAVEEPPPPAVDAATAAAFADHLLAGGDAYGALGWYRLSDFLAPDPATTFRIGLAYEHGERFAAAADVYGRLDSPDAALRAAICLHRAGEPGRAELVLTELPLRYPGSPQAEHAGYIRGLLALEAHDLEAAAARLSAVTGPLSQPAAALSQAALQPIPHRSPGLATTLSLIPGVGQLYAGHVGDGLLALAVSGGLGLWSGTLLSVGISEQRPGLTAAGGVLAGATLVTWSSNLVGAYTGAVRFNEGAARRRAEGLLEQAHRADLSLDPPLPE
jgi:hypothetical protein